MRLPGRSHLLPGRVLLVLAVGIPAVFLGICFFYPVLALAWLGVGQAGEAGYFSTFGESYLIPSLGGRSETLSSWRWEELSFLPWWGCPSPGCCTA